MNSFRKALVLASLIIMDGWLHLSSAVPITYSVGNYSSPSLQINNATQDYDFYGLWGTLDLNYNTPVFAEIYTAALTVRPNQDGPGYLYFFDANYSMNVNGQSQTFTQGIYAHSTESYAYRWAVGDIFRGSAKSFDLGALGVLTVMPSPIDGSLWDTLKVPYSPYYQEWGSRRISAKFELTPAPVPDTASTIILLGVSFGSLAIYRKRRLTGN